MKAGEFTESMGAFSSYVNDKARLLFGHRGWYSILTIGPHREMLCGLCHERHEIGPGPLTAVTYSDWVRTWPGCACDRVAASAEARAYWGELLDVYHASAV